MLQYSYYSVKYTLYFHILVTFGPNLAPHLGEPMVCSQWGGSDRDQWRLASLNGSNDIGTGSEHNSVIMNKTLT